MLHALKQGPFLRVLSLFAANRLKRLYINNLHAKLNFSNQGQSSPIKVFFCITVPAIPSLQYLSEPLMF
jgi:hypothetical protein